MIRFYRRTIKDQQIQEVPDLEVGGWVSVVNPSTEEIDRLTKNLGLDRDNLESGLDPNELPRLDTVREDIYIFTKMIPSLVLREIETYLIVIGSNFILTLSKTEPSFASKILGNKVDFVTTQKLRCLIEVLSLINEDFESLTQEVVKRVQVQRKTIRNLQEQELKMLMEQEIVLNELIFAYSYINLLYERILRKIKFFDQDKEIIEDLITETNEGFNICKSSLKTLSNIRNYYVISLSNKLNRIITILTIFTIILAVPAAISGVYGMNLILPLQEHPLGFYYVLTMIITIWGGLIFYFKKTKIF